MTGRGDGGGLNGCTAGNADLYGLTRSGTSCGSGSRSGIVAGCGNGSGADDFPAFITGDDGLSRRCTACGNHGSRCVTVGALGSRSFLLIQVHIYGNIGRGIHSKQRRAVGTGGGNIITEYQIDGAVVQDEALLGRRIASLPLGCCTIFQVYAGIGGAAFQRTVAVLQGKAVGTAGSSPDILRRGGSIQQQCIGQRIKIQTRRLHGSIVGICSSEHDVVTVVSGVRSGSSGHDQILAAGQVTCRSNQYISIGSALTGSGIHISAVLTYIIRICTFGSTGTVTVGAVQLVGTVTVGSVSNIVSRCGDLGVADNSAASITGHYRCAGGSTGRGSGSGRSTAVGACACVFPLVHMHNGRAGSRRGSRKQRCSVGTCGADAVIQSHVNTAALQAEALRCRNIASGPSGGCAVVQIIAVGGISTAVEGAVAVLQSEAVGISRQGEYKGCSRGRITGNRRRHTAKAQSATLHCTVGAVLSGGQCVIAVVSCVRAACSGNNDVIACGQSTCRSNQIISISLGCVIISCGVAAGRTAGRATGGTAFDKLIGRFNSLHCVYLALTGIGVLI